MSSHSNKGALRLYRLAVPVWFLLAPLQHVQASPALPVTSALALDGHTVHLPADLTGLNILIVGFSRGSADATTAWEIPVRKNLADDRTNLYDIALLEKVPSFLRAWVTRSLKNKVPPVLQSRFLPVFSNEKEWQQVCGYDSKSPDAAYVLLTDRSGKVVWQTHEAYSPANFVLLKSEIEKWADGSR